MDRPPLGVTVRWIAAGLASVGGLILLARMPRGDWDWSVLGKLLPGLGGLLVGVVFVAPELVRWALTPFSDLPDSILLPWETVVLPADLKLARFYGQSFRYAEAAEELRAGSPVSSRPRRSLSEGIRAAGLAGNERQAKNLYRAACRVLRARDQRQLLEGVYEAVTNRWDFWKSNP